MTSKIIFISTSVLLGIFALATLFGDNLRRLNGMSADALAGDDHVSQRKTFRNFGMSNTYDDAPPAPSPQGNTHVQAQPNARVDARHDALSTFAIDVDTASYTLARATLNQGALPVASGVRVEEWVNAFRYELPQPKDAPFSVSMEGGRSPFTAGRHVLKVSLKGREVANEDRLPAHLVFLVDTSGSMSGPDRIGLAKESLRLLVESLNARDTVALVTYAGSVSDVLPPTPANQRERIFAAIDSLGAGGGTAMGSGLELAYRHAVRGVSSGSVARVIVLSDGDANIGDTGADPMLEKVRAYVREGVTLTTVGFGMGNYRDALMEKLADSGNGQSVYIDSRDEARRVFQREVAGTLETIARDVKVQVEFDTRAVKTYRLIGYENRAVADADFRNDEVDGGEIGAGHSVTALYELELKPGAEGSLATVRVRGQRPRGSGAFETAQQVTAAQVDRPLAQSSTELRFAAAVAGAADLLRGNGHASGFTLEHAISLADDATNGRPERREFVNLMRKAAGLNRPRSVSYTQAY
ncbi:MAG: von Willebrand factor type A domain-containing protein [Myxococcaceae bacterium]|nr:von Willebrand factor type A domain-containing protein [Myxococcaceae bacterium]